MSNNDFEKQWRTINTEAAKSFSQAAQTAGTAILQLSIALSRFAGQIYMLAWDAYLKAGAPYGKTQKGFKRWLQELH